MPASVSTRPRRDAIGIALFLAASIAGVVPVACHRRAPGQTQPEVTREVKDTTRVVAIQDTATRNANVAVFFKDTAPTRVLSGIGRTFKLKTAAEREAMRTTVRRERELWRASRPRDYRLLLRVACFCPGTRGWLLMEVRGGQLLRAWDRTGRPVALTDWNTLSVDGVYDHLEHAADGDGQVQIAFDPRWHFPSYISGNSARVPDTWWVIDAGPLRPLR